MFVYLFTLCGNRSTQVVSFNMTLDVMALVEYKSQQTLTTAYPQSFGFIVNKLTKVCVFSFILENYPSNNWFYLLRDAHVNGLKFNMKMPYSLKNFKSN